MAGNSNSNQQRQSDDAEDLDIDTSADDSDRDESSRFSAANITRFSAVALFVVLGTFAVIQSMSGKPDDHSGHNHDDETSLANADPNKASDDPESKDSLDSIASKTAAPNSSAAELKTEKNVANSTTLEDQDAQISLVPDLALRAVSPMLIRNSSGDSDGFASQKVDLPTPKEFGGSAPPAQTGISRKSARAKILQPGPPAAASFANQTTTPTAESNSMQASLASRSKFSNELKPSSSLENKAEKKKFEAPKVVDAGIPKQAPSNSFGGNAFGGPMPGGKLRASSPPAMPLSEEASSVEPPALRMASRPGAGPILGSRGGFISGPPKVESNRLSPPSALQDDTSTTNQLRRNANPMLGSGSPNRAKQFSDVTSDGESSRASDADRLKNLAGESTSINDLPNRNRPDPGAPPRKLIPDTSNPNRPDPRRDLASAPITTNDLRNSISAAPLGDTPRTPFDRPAPGGRTDPRVTNGRNAESSKPLAPSPIPERREDRKFARTQAPAQSDTTPSTNTNNRLNTLANRLQNPSDPSRENSLVRSKANNLPSSSNGGATGGGTRSQQVPARPASNGGGFPSPSATAMPMMSRNSRTTPTAGATRDVPGDRQLEGVQAPALALQKLSPREVQVNQTSEFQLVIKNVGRSKVDDVRIFDQVPAGTTYEGANPQPASDANGQLRWDLGSMEPGAEKRISLKLKPTRPGEIGSVAQFTFASQSSMRTKVTQPVLEISHSTKPKVLIGDDVIIDVIVKNKGDGPARNVMIQEEIPEQLSFRESFKEIEYAIGTLLPGQSKNVRLALKAKKPGQLNNIMFATADGGLKSKHAVAMEVVSPKLAVKTNGPRRRFLGRNVTHSIGIDNQGTAAATNVQISAKLPTGVRYVSSNNQGTYKPSQHTVYWSLSKLDSQAKNGVELTTTPVNIGNHPIKVVASADLGLVDQTEHPLSIEHLVDVFFDIDDVVDPIEIGSDTRYRVQIVNQGTKTATNVQLFADFPNGLKPVSVDGPLTNRISGQQIVFEPINSLKPGDRISLVVTGRGVASGDHRVTLKLQSAERPTPVAKEESTRVYSDQ